QAWGDFTAAHSRYWAKRNGLQVSRLCVADKLAFVLTPAWLYLPMTRATGELREYMVRAKERQAGSSHFTQDESALLNSADAREWLKGLKSYTRRWVEAHRTGSVDTWTVAPHYAMRTVRVRRTDEVQVSVGAMCARILFRRLWCRLPLWAKTAVLVLGVIAVV